MQKKTTITETRDSRGHTSHLDSSLAVRSHGGWRGWQQVLVSKDSPVEQILTAGGSCQCPQGIPLQVV